MALANRHISRSNDAEATPTICDTNRNCEATSAAELSDSICRNRTKSPIRTLITTYLGRTFRQFEVEAKGLGLFLGRQTFPTLLAAFSTIGCSIENPAFDLPGESFDDENSPPNSTFGEGESAGDSAMVSSDTGNESESSFSTTESDDTRGPNDSGDASSTSSDTSSTSGDASSTSGDASSTSGDAVTGETTSDTGPEPDPLAYCERGALSCYTFDQISNDKIFDYGPLNEPLNLDLEASLGFMALNTDYLESALIVTNSSTITRDSHAWPFADGAIGIDVWLSVDDSNIGEFTLLQIGQYLQMGYDGSGNITCSTWEGDTKISVSVPYDFTLSTAHHIICAYDGTQLVVGGKGNASSLTAWASPESEATVWIANNPPGERDARFNGQLAALRIWDSLDKLVQTIEIEDSPVLNKGN